MQGPYVDQSKPFKKTTVCHECDKRFKKGEPKAVIAIVDDPWATKPRIIAVHRDNETEGSYGSCLDHLTDTSWCDHRYMECPLCERMVLMHNGWRSYVKHIGDDEICVRCYQDLRLEEGEPADAFEEGKIPGDFYTSNDLSVYGWGCVPGFLGVHITGEESVNRFCQQALKLLQEGYKVLVNYDSMGIGGSEGYISLHVKA